MDYCLIPYEALGRVSNFEVHLEKNLFNRSGLLGVIDPSVYHPDHSLLIWDFVFEMCHRTKTEANVDKSPPLSYVKFSRAYPQDFLYGRVDELNAFIDRIEYDLSSQQELDTIYKEMVSLITDELYEKVQHKKIKLGSSTDNKKRRTKKPWWNDNLTELWNSLCTAEKNMLKSRSADRRHSRAIYTQKCKLFNRECQKAKHIHLKSKQNDLEQLLLENNTQFWREIGKISIGNERRKNIPLEVVLPDGSISSDTATILQTWKDEFCKLLNVSSPTEQQHIQSTPSVLGTSDNQYGDQSWWNENITINEIMSAVLRLKGNKAEGLDGLPSEIWKNDKLLSILHSLFNQCFLSAKIPQLWKSGIINPVVKSSTSDLRDPLSYRGITITQSIYKLYCNVLNNRLCKWESENSVIHDSQNGFRKGRSTIDQIQSLTSLIDTRKLKGKSTFAAFIDFSKAYDSTDRHMLFQKLQNVGLNGNILNAIKSLYDGVNVVSASTG